MFPSLTELRSLEKETLKRIAQIGAFAKLGELQQQAHQAAALIQERRGGIDVHLAFPLDIRLRDKKRREPMLRRVDVGALVRVADDRQSILGASYGLLVCRDADPRKSPIVRKIHFDYEPVARRNAGEPKPSVHMQVCGKLSPHHLAAGYLESRLSALYPSWEKPRIPLPPTSLAILLNWLMLEFQSDAAARAILRDDRWRSLVACAERTVMQPYFMAASKFLASAANRGLGFAQHHLYEQAWDSDHRDCTD